MKLSGVAEGPETRVPWLGEHTDELLTSELGLSADAVAALRADGIRRMSAAEVLAPLPPVEQIRPGLWVVPVPIPMNSLRYVLVYVFATEQGAYLIDAGWNTDEAFDALGSGLGQAGFGIADVRGVMVTHIHPDHYGLAGRIRDASDAWVSLHPADAALIESRYIEPDELLAMVSRSLTRAGASKQDIEMFGAASMPVREFVQATYSGRAARGRRQARRARLEPAGDPHPGPLARPPVASTCPTTV